MEITGSGGFGFTVTGVDAEEAVHPFASVTVTEKFPELFTVIVCVVSLVLHRLPAGLLDVNCTFPPWQNVVLPFAVITGVVGSGLTVTVTVLVFVQPLPPVPVTV